MPPTLRFLSRLFVVALLACTACNGSSSSTSPGPAMGTDLANPPEIRSVQGVANVSLTATINPQSGGPAISYNGQFIPPTIRVEPGDTINITYTNALPATNAEPFNAANLHFHGLHVSPNPPVDDSIDLLAMPGQTIRYSIPIPKDHPTGLYWYHSHSHGESDWQAYNGMSGVIIVGGIEAFSPAVKGLPERVIVLRNILPHPDFSTLSNSRRLKIEQRRKRLDTDTHTVAGVCAKPFDIPGEITTINGASLGAPIAMLPGQSQFWRVVNASADGYYDLSIDGATLQLIAHDGVPLSAYQGATSQTLSHILIPPAGRAEFIVSSGAVGGFLRTTCTDTGPDGDANPTQVLAKLVNSNPVISPLVSSSAAPIAGIYSQPMSSFAQERTLAFTEDDQGFYLNAQAYTPQSAPLFTVASGSVERWTLSNATGELHAFHIHQTHFIVQDIDGVAQPVELRDTVTLPYQHADGTPSITHVLIDFRDPIIRGTFLVHCHLLEHEDGGMMAKILVQ